MQVVKQKSQINDNLSLTFYFANQGNKCIPNLRCGIKELYDEFFEAIPKNEIVAIGTNGFNKTNYQKAEWYCFVSEIVNKLNPRAIIVVGTLDKKIVNDFSRKCEFIFFDPWMYENRGDFYD